MSFDDLKAVDWAALTTAQAQFSPSAFLLDNAIPVAEPIGPTASDSDTFLPSDFNVALAAGKLPSWALSIPLLLTTVADEFAPADGQLNSAPVPAPYFAVELNQFIGETAKVEAILISSAYALGTGDDAVRDALNKVRPERASPTHFDRRSLTAGRTLYRSGLRASGRAPPGRSHRSQTAATESLSASYSRARRTQTTQKSRTAPARSATRTTSF